MFTKKMFYGLIVLLVLQSLIINLVTIKTFPSWFDEAFFANIAFNLSLNEGLILDLIPGYFNGEIFVYGPIYFYIQSFLIKLFGLSDFIFRLPNYISAYISIIIFIFILRRHEIAVRYQIAFCLAGILDISVNRNLVSGRMDMVAVMFVAFALYLMIRPNLFNWLNYLRWFAIGLICAVAYLTTPRALFLMPVIFIVGLQNLIENYNENKKIRPLIALIIIAFFAFLVPVWFWIIHAGGLDAYILLFTGNSTTLKHIAPSFYRSFYDNVAISLMIFLIILSYKKIIKSAFLLGLVLTYIVFSLFVREFGPYAAMIMPFVLVTVIILIADPKFPRWLRLLVHSLIILPGILLIGLRTLDIYLNQSCRGKSEIIVYADNLIKSNKNIIAPFKYYFTLEGHDRNFLTLEYSKIENKNIIEAAQFIVISKHQLIDLESRGFSKIGQLTCNLKHVPFLPGSFYDRSVFDEIIYSR
jgi:hypothetical protein